MTVQAYALAWTLPYRVECMSVTSAFALGFDRSYCAEGCRITRPSPYFDSPSNEPFKDHGLRPAMMLAGRDVAGVKAMIDRGVRSDQRWPAGTGYLLSTGDRNRNVRAVTYRVLPTSSATGTNAAGKSSPCRGWCQRANASYPTVRRLESSTIGW